MRFRKESRLAAPAAAVFAFHERPDAFARLQPPWQTSEILQPPTSLAVGTEVILRVKVGPIWRRIVARHVAYEPGVRFVDRMIEGPFKRWEHEHLVRPVDDQHCLLVDDIQYELPLGRLGRWFGGGMARRQLERLFEYRHRVTRDFCEAGA